MTNRYNAIKVSRINTYTLCFLYKVRVLTFKRIRSDVGDGPKKKTSIIILYQVTYYYDIRDGELINYPYSLI